MRDKIKESYQGQSETPFRLAQWLGVVSILLGIAELVWAGPLGRSLGMGGYEWVLQVYGAREFLNGILILVSKAPGPWIWLRVIGDVIDASTLIWGYTRHPEQWAGITTAFIAVTPVVIADIYCAIRLSRESKGASSGNYGIRRTLPFIG